MGDRSDKVVSVVIQAGAADADVLPHSEAFADEAADIGARATGDLPRATDILEYQAPFEDLNRALAADDFIIRRRNRSTIDADNVRQTVG